jgi:carboxypeptidase Taq
MTLESAYSQLVARLRNLHTLGSIGELLGWDEQVNLPPQSAEQRGEQHAAMAEMIHVAASAPAMGACLEVLEEALTQTRPPGSAGDLTLSDDQRAVVRQARRDYDRATKLPPEFVREKATQGSIGYHAWARAKKMSNFAGYAPILEKNLELAKREAGYLGWGDRPYDYMIDRHDPGMTAAAIGRLFDELKAGLVPLVQEMAKSSVRAPQNLMRGFPVDQQRT